MVIINAPKIDHQIEIHEFDLPVPWGHIACKWWGPKTIQPIICMHGMQDNAGTFDRLIPYLPNDLSYLVIEFPGHGFSSPIPHGMTYTYATFLYVLLFVIKKFDWKRVSLLGHSMGAMVSYIFAATFPNRCHMVINVDLIRPDTLTKTFDLKFLLRDINYVYVADQRNQENSEPPSYTFDAMIQKRYSNEHFALDMESIPFILYRGIKPSSKDPNKFYFSCDNRLKSYTILIPIDVYEDIGKSVISPYCFIKARKSLFPVKDYTRIIENMKSNPDFELHLIDGGHHVHLDDPKTIGDIVSKFIRKYRRIDCKL